MSGNLESNSNAFLNQENVLTNSFKQTNSDRSFDISLTVEQFKVLQKFMPPSYSLIQAKSTKPFLKKNPPSKTHNEDNYHSTSPTQKDRRDAFSKAERKIKEPIEFMKKCEYIVTLLKKHKFGFPFGEPVDPEVLGIPDYFDVIKEPMDISKVEKRLKSGFYKQLSEFETDVRKIWDNALTYNKSNTQIYEMTTEIKTYFETLINEDEVVTQVGQVPKPRIQKVNKVNEVQFTETAYRPPKTIQINKQVNQKPLTYQEKKVLSDLIRQLPSESLWEVWKIVSPDNQNQEQEIEFDIETLSPAISRQLEEFVKSKLQTISNKKTKIKTNQNFRENGVAQIGNEKTKAIKSNAIYSEETQLQITQPHEIKKVVQVQKIETDSDSFLGNLSESDD